jgi:hypothetical protein
VFWVKSLDVNLAIVGITKTANFRKFSTRYHQRRPRLRPSVCTPPRLVVFVVIGQNTTIPMTRSVFKPVTIIKCTADISFRYLCIVIPPCVLVSPHRKSINRPTSPSPMAASPPNFKPIRFSIQNSGLLPVSKPKQSDFRMRRSSTPANSKGTDKLAKTQQDLVENGPDGVDASVHGQFYLLD